VTSSTKILSGITLQKRTTAKNPATARLFAAKIAKLTAYPLLARSGLGDRAQ
jgi:hypothetical protein